jgi:spore germination protein GerM
MTLSRRHRVIGVAVALTGALGCGSCGLAADKHPREITDRAITALVSPASNSTTPSSTGREHAASLYFVKGERLKRFYVPASGGPVTPARALTLLLNGPSRTARKDLTTSIPPGTTLRGVSRSGSTLRIDLSGDIKSLGGSAAKAAYAQLVFTALDLPGVKSVRFAIDGDNIDAITDDGSLTVIRAKNFKSPLRPA